MSQFQTREPEPGTLVVDLEGEMDLSNASDIRKQLIARMQDGLQHLVINLAGLTFLDSTGLGALLAATLKAQAMDARVSFVAPQARVRQVCKIAGLREGVNLWETEDQVLGTAAPT